MVASPVGHGLWGIPASVVVACGLSSCSSRLWSTGSVLVAHRLSTCGSQACLLQGMWGLPRLGIKPMSPVLAGEFLTTELPREPQHNVLKIHPC